MIKQSCLFFAISPCLWIYFICSVHTYILDLPPTQDALVTTRIIICLGRESQPKPLFFHWHPGLGVDPRYPIPSQSFIPPHHSSSLASTSDSSGPPSGSSHFTVKVPSPTLVTSSDRRRLGDCKEVTFDTHFIMYLTNSWWEQHTNKSTYMNAYIRECMSYIL